MSGARSLIPFADRLATNADTVRPQWAAVRAVVASIDALGSASDIDMMLLEDALDRLADRTDKPALQDCGGCGGHGRRDGYVCRECVGEGGAA